MNKQQQQQLQECSKVWICDTLTNLNHPNPQSVCDCLCIINTSVNERMIADKQFQLFIQWIEDTIIRQWEPLKRKQFLRNTKKFWTNGIIHYIQHLDCPTHYYNNTTNVEGWKYDFHLRKRILHWIVTCAISDSYEEHKQPTNHTTSPTQQQQQQQQLHSMRLTYIQKMKQIQLQLNQQICHNIQLQSNNI